MPAPTQTIRRAKRFRREMTLPEVLVWQRLRTSPMDLKFRRQHPIGRFVLDFYCALAKTGIEIDGMAHGMGDHPARDEARDLWLHEHGIAMIRVPVSDVLADVDQVIEAIVGDCLAKKSPPSALRAATSPLLRNREE